MQILTRVRAMHKENEVNVWLPFGRSVKERRISAHARDIYFVPGAIFSCVTWQGDAHRTHQWRAEVLRAVASSEERSELSNVEPGAEILLRVSGNTRVTLLLELFRAIEQAGKKLIAVPADYWTGIHNRLAAGREVGVYASVRPNLSTASWGFHK